MGQVTDEPAKNARAGLAIAASRSTYRDSILDAGYLGNVTERDKHMACDKRVSGNYYLFISRKVTLRAAPDFQGQDIMSISPPTLHVPRLDRCGRSVTLTGGRSAISGARGEHRSGEWI